MGPEERTGGRERGGDQFRKGGAGAALRRASGSAPTGSFPSLALSGSPVSTRVRFIPRGGGQSPHTLILHCGQHQNRRKRKNQAKRRKAGGKKYFKKILKIPTTTISPNQQYVCEYSPQVPLITRGSLPRGTPCPGRHEGEGGTLRALVPALPRVSAAGAGSVPPSEEAPGAGRLLETPPSTAGCSALLPAPFPREVWELQGCRPEAALTGSPRHHCRVAGGEMFAGLRAAMQPSKPAEQTNLPTLPRRTRSSTQAQRGACG